VAETDAEVAGVFRRCVAQDEVDRAAGAGGKLGRAVLDDLDAFDQVHRQLQRSAVAAGQGLTVDDDARFQSIGRLPAATASVTADAETDAGQLAQDFADGGGVELLQVFAADDDLGGGRFLAGGVGIECGRTDLHGLQRGRGVGRRLSQRRGRGMQAGQGDASGQDGFHGGRIRRRIQGVASRGSVTKPSLTSPARDASAMMRATWR